MRLAGKVAIVTGAAGGFGKAIASRFAEEGAHVVCFDRAPLPKSLPQGALYYEGDHTNRTDNEAVVALALKQWGKLDILINNAGIGRSALLGDLTDELWDDVQNVNLNGHFRLTQAALPALLDGLEPLARSIVYTSSGMGLYGVAGASAYVTSKHAVIGLMRAAAQELGPQGIRVNAICPGISVTGFADAITKTEDTGSKEDLYERIRKTTPLRKIIEPIDIANAALFLVSDEGRLVHSVALPVDGGRTHA